MAAKVSVGASAPTVIEYFWLAVSRKTSVAVTVKLKGPTAVAVPVTAPVPAFRVSPVGRVPALL